MIHYVAFSVLMVCAVASNAASSVSPKIPAEDLPSSRRIEHVILQDGVVYPLLGVFNHPLVIEFPKNQIILEVAGGAIGGWDVQRKGSRLFLRALKHAKLSTLLVVTDSNSFVFDLVPASPSPQNLRVRRSKFVFDAPSKKLEKPVAIAAPVAAPVAVMVPPQVKKPAEKLVEVAAPVSPAVKEPKVTGVLAAVTVVKKPQFNRNYSMQIVKEEAVIHPKEVFDDGVFTWFLFPKNQSIPVVYKSVPGTKEESVINFHMEGDYLVAHATAALWNLRLGGSLVGVYNDLLTPLASVK